MWSARQTHRDVLFSNLVSQLVQPQSDDGTSLVVNEADTNAHEVNRLKELVQQRDNEISKLE